MQKNPTKNALCVFSLIVWMHVCTLFQVQERGEGTQQRQRQPAAISRAWQSCQNASARPLTFRSTGHTFLHQGAEEWDLEDVFIYKDRQICTKKGTSNHTETDKCKSVTGTRCEDPANQPTHLSGSSPSVTDTGKEPGGQRLAFYKNINRLILECAVSCQKEKKMTVKIELVSQVHPPTFCWYWHTWKSNPCLLQDTFSAIVLRHEQACLSHGSQIIAIESP